MKNTVLILLLAFVFGGQSLAQNRKADKLFEYYDYAEAIPFYLKAVEKGSEAQRKHATLRLASCFRMINNAPKAAEWYQKAVAYEDVDPENFYYLGEALRTLGKYQEAKEAFQRYVDLVPDDEKGKRYLKFCEDIDSLQFYPPVAEVKNIEAMNSRYSDFCPVFYRDGIVFTSDRPDAEAPSNIYGWTNHSYLNLYYTIPEYYKVFWNGVPEPHAMSHNFNQTYHDGPACFSADGKWVFMTRTVHSKPRKTDGNIKTYLLKIFYAEITGDKKPEFKAFPYNQESYSVGHPALSPDGTRLIFASDQPDGYGGSDLYLSEWKNGAWTTPVNLGANVNSPGDEVFPYWATEDTLYFASNGHLGFGGLDIFKSVKQDTSWGKPENMLRPINSSYDDFGIVFKENMKEGLLSSNRPEGKGNDDIYGFRLLDRKAPEPRLVISGRVVDNNHQPIEGATVFLLDPVKNSVKILKSRQDGTFEDKAAYQHNYIVKAMKNGYIYDGTSFLTPVQHVSKYALPRDLMLLKLEVNQKFKVENIYYDLDKWYIRKDAEPALNKLVQLMKEYPITAELSSHTDCRASDEYNMELSQKRAEAAVRYIVLQGINPARITARGYGESQLVNRCADGVPCTEEEHQQNRRTEFKITSIGATVGGDFIDLSKFKEGDIIPAPILGAEFFANCME